MRKNKALIKLTKEMAGKHKFTPVLIFIMIIISTAAGVSGSFFIQKLIDDYLPKLIGSDSPDFSEVNTALLITSGIYLIGVIATFCYTRMMVVISQRVQKKIRDDMFSHLQRLPINYFDTHTHGEIMSRFTNDIDTLREFLSQGLPQVLSSLFTIAVVTVVMLKLNLLLSGIVFLFVIGMLYLTRTLGGKSKYHFIRQQKNIGILNGYMEEIISGQKVVKVFCYEEAVKREFAEKNEALRIQAAAANRLTNIFMPVMMNIGNLQYVVIALAGGVFVLSGIPGITMGTIAAFLTLSKAFSAPIGQISMQINSAMTALAGAERIYELIDEEPESDEGYVTLVNAEYPSENSEKLTECSEHTGIWAWKTPAGYNSKNIPVYTELKGDVRLNDVDFGYTEDTVVLKNVSLFAKPGQKIAFVGATGAGKTTITNLLNRFYDINKGNITFDGIEISNIKKSDLRSSLGMVLQDTHLFSGSVADNIRFGCPEADSEQIINAAKLAGANDFISRLPNGYDTIITGDGENLSGGQRQLIAIARAAVSDPPVIILDEATSGIDTRTESIVQKGMDKLMKGRTVFVIAHRLSTVKNADAIMVMEHGKIIERGNHAELMELKGKYYRLYTGAFRENN